MNFYPSITRTSLVGTRHADTPEEFRTVEVVTDGRVGSEADAIMRATELLHAPALLSHRDSYRGELRFYFTDREAS